jgi:hypothetical protein
MCVWHIGRGENKGKVEWEVGQRSGNCRLSIQTLFGQDEEYVEMGEYYIARTADCAGTLRSVHK